MGVDVLIYFPDLTDNELTFLSADETSGQTTLSVDSGRNFVANDYVVIGEGEFAEIRKLSSQSDTTITTDTTLYAHSRGTKVQFIPYNQIVVSRSTDGVTYTALSAVDINPQNLYTVIHRTTDVSTDYYKARFYNSTLGVTGYSDYSDVVTATGYADNTVWAIKDRALRELGEQKSELITDQFLNESLWEGRRELDQDPRVNRWSWRNKIDENIGSIVSGTYTFALPTNLRDPESNKNISSIRIGKENTPLDYQDTIRFNQNYLDVAHTTLNGAVLTADTSIILTDSGDFDESGSIYVASQAIGETVDVIAYTANTETTNTISGVTGIRTAGHATGTDVWQDVSFGKPTAYTVDGDSGVIKFDVPFKDDLAGENIYMDYYSTMTAYDSDADLLDEPSTDLFVNYLKWKIKSKQSGGKLMPTQDPDFILWERGKETIITKEYLGRTIRLIPS